MPQSENESTPRFNKAIIGRIVAVLIFVALGTYAVIQSIKDKPAAAVVEPDTNTTGAPGGEGLPKGAGGEGATGNSDGVNHSVFTPSPSNQAYDFESSTAKKPLSRPKNNFSPVRTTNPRDGVAAQVVNPTNNAFPGTPPPTKSFSIDQPRLPVVVANPRKTPPDRFAQAPGGPPIIGSTGGYGTRKTAPPVLSNKIDNPAINGMLGTGEKIATTGLNQRKTDDKESANEFLKKTSDQVIADANSLTNNARSFGPNPTTSRQFPGPPPAKPFVLPSIQSDFRNRISVPNQMSVRDASTPPNATRIPDNSSLNNSRNLAPIIPAKPDASKFGADPKSLSSSTQGLTSRQITGKQSSDSSSTSSPFGNLNVTSSSRTTAPTTPLRAPPLTNQRSNTSSFPNSTLPSINNRPLSRLNTVLPSTSTDLTTATPGDRQLEGVQATALTIEKLAPREIQVDQAAEFQLVIKNVGRVAANDVRVFDQIPSGTEFLGASPETANQPRAGALQWNIGKLRPGQEKRIKFQLKPTRPGEMGSVAHVTFSTQASMRTLVTKPVLEIIHQSKPTHLIGDDVILDVVVKNKGDGPAKNVLIQEDVPKQLEFQDGYRELEYEIGTLMPGQSRRVQLVLKAAQVGKLRNVMFASATGGLQAKHELPMEVVAPKLVVRADGPTRRFLQRNVTHEFNVANNGTAPATNVELVARLPSGLRFLSANKMGRYDANAHSVYWSLAELARGVEAKVELQTMPIEVGNQPIKFESFADLKVKANVEQALSVEHLVDVFFDIDDVVDPIEIGSTTRYRVRVVNQGTKSATNVHMQVDFPPGLLPTSVDGSLRHGINGQRITFEPINSLTPGDEISIVIHAKGQSAGDHRVVVNMRTDGRQAQVSKEETTRVYSDR